MALEEALEIDAQQEHERLSEAGKQGVIVRESLKEMRRAAMTEGRKFIGSLNHAAILTDKAEQEKARLGLVELAKKYPRVAEEVGDGLIAEFRLGAFKDLIKGTIADAIAEGPGNKDGQTGGFYGI